MLNCWCCRSFRLSGFLGHGLEPTELQLKKGLRERPRTSSTGDLLAGAAPRRKRSRRGVAQTLPKRGRHGVRRSQSSASPRQSIGDLTEDYRGKLTLDLRENLVFAGSRVKLTLLRRRRVSEHEQSHRAPGLLTRCLRRSRRNWRHCAASLGQIHRFGPAFLRASKLIRLNLGIEE